MNILHIKLIMKTVQKSEVWMFHRIDNKQGEMSYILRDGKSAVNKTKQKRRDSKLAFIGERANVGGQCPKKWRAVHTTDSISDIDGQ